MRGSVPERAVHACPIVAEAREARDRPTTEIDVPEDRIVATAELTASRLEELLGDDAESLLQHECKTIDASRSAPAGPRLRRPRLRRQRPQPAGPAQPAVAVRLTAASAAPATCRILPVDQGIEHSAGASFAPNPIYFDPENIVKLAIEGGCNAVASTLRRARRGRPQATPTRSRSSSSSTTTSS